MEKIQTETIEALLEGATREMVEKIKNDEMPCEVSAIAEYIKNKGILSAGFELNDTAQKIFNEIENSLSL